MHLTDISVTFYIFLVFVSLNDVSSYSETPTQYHIQTDDGPNRYFRYQTYNGQYRKEKLFNDGTVIGTYGWVDPRGLLRLYDYMANDDGYKIVRKKVVKVKKPRPSANRIPVSTTKISGAKRRPSVDNRQPLLKVRNTTPETTTTISTTTSSTTITKDAGNTSPSTKPEPEVPLVKSKPKFRPLFVSKKKRKPVSRFTDRRRQNFVSARQKVRLQQKKQQQQQEQQQSHTKQFDASVDGSTVRKQPIRTKTVVRPHSSPSVSRRRQNSAVAKSITNFGYDEPGGKVTINFDLGNQYRKEKIFKDGTVIGEHGYVDPFGILRVTTYTSGPKGLREAKKSYWVGTRTPST